MDLTGEFYYQLQLPENWTIVLPQRLAPGPKAHGAQGIVEISPCGS